MRIRQGDLVVVVTGNGSGTQPRKVLEVVDGGDRLLIEGVNRAYKHVKKGHPKSPQGGRLSKEMPIDSSNAMYYCGECKKAVRLGARYLEDGSKERFCKKCNNAAGKISPPRAAYAKKS